MALTVNGVPHEPGCYVDGHLGQYAGYESVELADTALGTHLQDDWPRDDGSPLGTYGRTGNPWASITGEDDGAVEHMASIMDQAEEALNAATEGGFWSWEDGEFFLTETAGECPECGGTLAVGPDGTACLDECCVSNSMMYGGRE